MSDDTFDGESFSIGMLIGAVLTFILTLGLTIGFGVNKWHNRTCDERFNQAITASDSLTVIVDDTYCNTRLDR